MKIQNDRQTTAKYSSVEEEAEASKFVTERMLKLDWQPWVFPYGNYSNCFQNPP